MKSIWKTAGVRVWIIITSILLVLLIIATIVVTSVPFLYGTINSAMGGERRVLKAGDPSKYMYHKADYESKSQVLAAANSLNERINEEGIILLKNDDNVLPMTNKDKITVFGKNSVSLVLGGSGSSAGVVGGDGGINLYTSLTAAGFQFNPVMKSFYDSSSSGSGRPKTPTMGDVLTGYPISETPVGSYTQEVKDSYSEYSDAALVVISRIGGEGYDLPRTMFWNGSNYTSWTGDQKIPGARSKEDHYLQIDQNETDMIAEACNNFQNVIIVINCSTSMELGFLDDPTHYAYNPNIKAALWIGNPGKSGINALGKVLKGTVNPSGKTIDTYARDFRNDPTWNNFGNNLTEFGNRYTLDGKNRGAYFVEYEEGIYIGYRYYETRGFTDGDSWYKSNVVFPLGYGLSYTSFEWSIVNWLHADNAVLTAESQIAVTVRVKNTGTLPGKDVVQLYYTAPYISGGIEKAHVVLCAFEKTQLLAPDEFQDITLNIKVRDMASYDFNDANGNGFKGFELDAGNYDIKVMKNANTVFSSSKYSIPATTFDKDDVTGNAITNLFDNVSDYITNRDGYMTRADWSGTWPTAPTSQRREETSEFISSIGKTYSDDSSSPWYTDTAPTQSSKELSYKQAQTKLYHLIDKSYDDPLWDDLLDQLTVSQMRKLITQGNFRTLNIDSIGKPLTIDADGPMGFAIFMGDPAVYDTAYYASECVLGATWSKELAFEMGEMIGNEGLVGYEKGDGRPYSGWYAPAMNIHRSQFGGRNFEYYSEDSHLSSVMASGVVKGAKSKGVYTFLKHFALNDQETKRDTNGLLTWANEQSMREIYFKPFEESVKEGKATAMMSSFNRIGTVWAGGNYNLLTRLLRDEWGFRGMVITDFNLTTYMNVDQMIRAGGDLSLSADKEISKDDSATAIASTRQAAKNILYTVVQSNAMNGMGEGVIYSYALPLWVIYLILADVGVAVLCGAWGTLMIVLALKKKKRLSKEKEAEAK